MIVFRFSKVARCFEISGVKGEESQKRGYFRPPADIVYSDGQFIIKIDLPGVESEDLQVVAGQSEISVCGVVNKSHPGGACRLMERSSGEFLRSISFPCSIDPEGIKIDLSNGVLMITVPSPEAVRDPTRIEIPARGLE